MSSQNTKVIAHVDLHEIPSQNQYKSDSDVDFRNFGYLRTKSGINSQRAQSKFRRRIDVKIAIDLTFLTSYVFKLIAM